LKPTTTHESKTEIDTEKKRDKGLDFDERTEEYEQEARQLMVSMRVDKGHVEDT
jgi:hypothetical protein